MCVHVCAFNGSVCVCVCVCVCVFVCVEGHIDGHTMTHLKLHVHVCTIYTIKSVLCACH